MIRYVRAAVLCASLACEAALAEETGGADSPTENAVLVQQLTEGDAGERLAALGQLETRLHKGPDLLLPAVMECARRSDARLKAAAITVIGRNLIWVEGPQNRQAIQFALEMSRDDDPDVLHACVYFCLSTVREKSAEIVDRLIEIACEHEAMYRRELHRVAWGLRGQQVLASERIQAYLDRQEDGAKRSPAVAIELYYRVTGAVPKRVERFAGQGEFAVIVKLADPLRPTSREDVVATLRDALGGDIAACDVRPGFQDDEAFAVVLINGVVPYIRMLTAIESTPGLQKAWEATMITPESRRKIEAAANAIPAGGANDNRN